MFSLADCSKAHWNKSESSVEFSGLCIGPFLQVASYRSNRPGAGTITHLALGRLRVLLLTPSDQCT